MALAASGATEAIAAFHSSTDEGELVGTLLVRNPEVNTGLTPLGTMRGKPAAPVTVLRNEVGEFMEEGLLHLGLRDLPQGGIEPDLPTRRDGDTGRGTHPGIPPDSDHPAELRGHRKEERGNAFLEEGIAQPGR